MLRRLCSRRAIGAKARNLVRHGLLRVWQFRGHYCKSLGDGIYELRINVPQTGVYMLFVESTSMGVRYADLPYLMLHATE